MARKPRVHYEGALYHVMARGNNGEYILKSKEDKELYIETIKRYKKKDKFNLFAYCIMDNHIHLLIQVKEEPLGSIMQKIQQVYTQTYNKRYKRTGHVFQQRYKAILCGMDEYLLHLTKYIHFNPVQAKITKDVNYKWSSFEAYKNGNNEFVDVDFVLQMMMKDKRKAIKEFVKYMNDPLVDIDRVEYEIIGVQVKEKIEDIKWIDIEKLIKDVRIETGVSEESLVSKSRIAKISNARKQIVLRAAKECEINNVDLAKRLNISIAAISKIKSRTFT